MITAITIIGNDRSGIITALTESVYRAGGNLEDASMTILEGEFAMILLADLKTKSVEEKLKRNLAHVAKKFNLQVAIRNVAKRLIRGEKHIKGTVPYLISVFGKDRSGIVFQITKCLSERGLNITGLNSKIIGRGKQSIYTLILEVDMKRALAQTVEKKLRSIAMRLGVDVAIHPVETVHL